MSEKKRQPRRKPREQHVPRHNAVSVTIWSMNGEPVPTDLLDEIEMAVTTKVLASPIRLLTSTTRT